MNSTILACFLLFSLVSAEKKILHVGALLELSNHWYEEYVNFFDNIIEHAFEKIENRTDILADYSLKLITKDTQVMISINLSIFIAYLYI